MANEMLVLGVDPALGTTGYGVVKCAVNSVKLVDAGFVRCSRNESLERRLDELHRGIVEIIAEHKPDCVAIEEVYSHYDRPTTAILMGHARGVILLAAAQAGLQVSSYASTKVKKALTSNGRASKAQMQFAVQHQLNLPQLPEPADVADALAIAICHYHSTQGPARLLGRNVS